MRKFLLLSLCLIGFFGYSQETTSAEVDSLSFSRHELRLNAAYLLFGVPEISYEYLLNKESGVGLSIAIPTGSNESVNYLAIPYYRIYFGKKPAAGFFIEGNAAVFSESHYIYSLGFDSHQDIVFHREKRTETGAGVGLAIGGKFMTKSDWIGEIVGGAGRILVNDHLKDTLYLRLGVSIGKRF